MRIFHLRQPSRVRVSSGDSLVSVNMEIEGIFSLKKKKRLRMQRICLLWDHGRIRKEEQRAIKNETVRGS